MNRKQKKMAKMAASKPAETPKSAMHISNEAVSTMRNRPSTRHARKMSSDYFAAYEPPKGVLPGKLTGKRIAMDAGFDSGAAFNNGLLANINSAFNEGYAFPGFTVLANWSQIPEFRRPAEIFAREMTRKWIKFQAVGDSDKSEKIKAIDAEFKRLNVQAVFRKAIEQDGFFGRSQIFIDVGLESDDIDPEELRTDLVEEPEKIGKGALKRLANIEPIWSYPNRYNADDPLDKTFYKPTSWFVMGKEIHSSRLITIITRPLPDILKPAYAFAGLSLLQMMKPYVDNWLRTRQSVSDLVHSFTVWVLATDFGSLLNAGGAEQLYNRAALFNAARDNHGLNMIEKEKEDFSNVSANIAGLDKLQAQAQEQMCSPSGLPVVYLTGITPAGLNPSSQGEIEVFQDTISANQEIYTPALSKILNIVQLSLFGEIDPDIGFTWNQLKVVTQKELADIRKTEAETDIAHLDAGILSQEEVRKKLANEEESPYSGIDLNAVIDPPEAPGKEPGMNDFSENIGSE